MKNRIPIIVIGSTLLIAALLFLVWNYGSNSATNQHKYYSYNWDKKFGFQSKDPKGLYLFFSLLKFKNPNQKIYDINSSYKFDSILRNDDSVSFIFIGDTIGLLDSELELLLKKYRNGSSIFISANQFGQNIKDSLFSSIESAFDYNTNVDYRFNGMTSKFYGRLQNDTIAQVWNGFKNFVPRIGQADGLVRQKNLTTLIRIKENQNTILVQSNPEPLLNYQLKHQAGFKHIDFVTNQIPLTGAICFVSTAQIRPFIEDEGTEDYPEEKKQNLLELIVNNKILLNTMVLILLGAILFVVFRTKRRRAIIPIETKQLSVTKTFVETIASIFLNKQNPYSILQIQRKNFFDTILRYYYVDLLRNRDDTSLELLAEKTSYPLMDIRKLIKELTYENRAIGNEYLHNVTKLLHQFYRHCGIITETDIRQESDFEVSRNIWLSTLIMIAGSTISFVGLYMLVNSNGTGVILWILGFLILSFGIVRIVIPHIRVKQHIITYYSNFCLKIHSDNLQIKEVSNSAIDLKINQKEFSIPTWDTMQNDLVALKRYIHQNKKS